MPPYPEPCSREQLFFILGELHERLEPSPSATPEWLSIPDKGLYTGIASFGSIGSGKTRGLILPAMHQLFGYRSFDSERKLSGIALEVKGDLCLHLAGILKKHGREHDYVEGRLDVISVLACS